MSRFPVALIISLVLITGCKKSSEEYLLPAPRVLTLSATGTDSLSIRLIWDRVEEAYRYVVEFNGIELAMVQETTWIDPSPEELGVYEVFSYRDGRRSVLSAGASDTLVSAESSGPIYGSSVGDPDHPSGFVWTLEGEGRCYPLTRPDSVDIYFETQTPPGSRDLADISEHFLPGAFESHAAMAYSDLWGFDEVLVAPEVDLIPRLPVIVGGMYLIKVRGRYVKLEITEYDSLEQSLTFRYAIQTVAGFRRLGPEE